jgi:hypothetical protein
MSVFKSVGSFELAVGSLQKVIEQLTPTQSGFIIKI